MNTHFGRALFTTALAALSVGVLIAQDITGTWQGTLKDGKGKETRIAAKISKAQEKLSANLYTVDQANAPIPVGTVTFRAPDLKFEIPSMGATYEARLSPDGNSFTGTFTVAQPQPFTLTRATPETAWAIPDPPPPAKTMAADIDPSFEVATIKPANPDRPGQSILVDRTGMLNTTNTSLKDLMIFSYGVHPGQIQGLPSWAEDLKFDVSGKPDHEGVGNDVQIRSMMKKLLAERFGLTLHRENKELSAFTLNVAKGGPKLTVNETGGNLPGFGGQGPGRIGVRNSTMAQFAGFLQARIVDRPVVDKTGLTGKYDFTLAWRPDQLGPTPANAPPPPADLESRPDIYGAMQEQLGLRFQAEKTAVEVLVVDKVSKPDDN